MFHAEKKNTFMDYRTSLNICLKEKYFNFTGRASYSEFWYFVTFLILIYVGLPSIFATLPIRGSYTLLTTIYSLSKVFFLIPQIAVTARRLHDVNMSGWWQLFIIVPITFNYMLPTLETAIFAVVCLIVLLYFLVQKGTAGENKFGIPPTGDDWELRRDQYNKERIKQ